MLPPRTAKKRPASPPADAPEWHALPADEVLAALHAYPGGLSTADALRRRALHGPNALPVAQPTPALLRFLAQFHSALIYPLLAAASAAGLLGHVLDASVIVGVVLINAVIGFVQEGRAENALAAIRTMISPRAHALRDGRRTALAATDLVPGDVVLLEAGDRIPADLRLLRARGLQVDEALLTGESVVARKQELPAPSAAALGDRHSMAYSGSLVVAGQATGVVVATGGATELGRIGALLSTVQSLTTPLLQQVDRFGRRFALWVVCAGMLLVAHAVVSLHWAWVDALMAVVAMAVAVIPEGLPAVITITLAVGVRRMAARKAVIRRLPAVETLGATSVICTDKTGTLTRNEMTARRIVGPASALVAEGSGYEPHGRLLSLDGTDDADALAQAMPLLRCAVLCNDARLHEASGEWAVTGDPMEGALLALARKAGMDPEHEQAEWSRLDEIPFDAAHRYMATLHVSPSGASWAFVKGAPEAVMGMDPVDSNAEEGRMAAIARCAAEGERVLGFGVKELPPGTSRLTQTDLGQGVTWLGLVGFLDPPRAEAAQAIAECHAAGISVKMITGDHASTATAIARQLALAQAPRTLTGAQLDAIPDERLAETVEATDVFARTSPEHKLRIVQALQSQGRVVAMTGDGVNDAPSLKQADVGVAMGVKGTEAAKEAAEMVLLDDNFATIVDAVHEGRTVYDNIRKVIAWTLPTNGGEVAGVLVAVLFGLTLPMSPAQILWVNLVTSVTLGLALAFEPAEPGVMRRPPRGAREPLLSRFMLWRTVLVSSFIAAVTLGLLHGIVGQGGSVEEARTVAVNALVAMEVGYLFSVRFLNASSFSLRAALGTPAVLWALVALAAAQAAFTYLPAMNRLFATVPLGLPGLLLAAAAGASLMLLLEAEKALVRFGRRRTSTGASSGPWRAPG